ncbi:pyridoxamine 5'-phosphate oxidase family protein [Kitasatospora aureofaciens]|uniref:pyridoxamine 5'-phosphate oxidase family protein n=1 Tax=Kitasatospora aureofaciens TaxID=1894 RepID=UPI0033C62157
MTADVDTALDRTQCMALLAVCRYGRAVFTEQALPVVVPVPFLLDADGIVIGDGGDGRLDPLGDGDVVLFQADRMDPGGGNAESVTVTGNIHGIGDLDEFDRLTRFAPNSWHPGSGERAMRIDLALVRGRRYRLNIGRP